MPLNYPIHTRTLENGLRVVISPDHAIPTVSINLWVEVGSRHEEPGRTGLAHLFEHLMFQGSQRVAEGEHTALLMEHGGRVNATTSFDRTAYVESVPTNAVELALWLEADRQGHLLPALTQTNLDNQRDVVVQEKRQRYDTVPYGDLLTQACRLLFPEDHPYHHPTIGLMGDLAAASLADVQNFYQAHYGPETIILTLAGDLDPGAGFALAERYLGQLSGQTSPRPAAGPMLGPLPGPVELTLTEDVPTERIYLAFRLPPVTDPDFSACALALDALVALTTSRVQRHLLRQSELISGSHASALGLVDGVSIGLIVVDVSDGIEPEQAEQALRDELSHFLAAGPTAAELEAARADTERSWLEGLTGLDDRAALLSRAAALFGDPGQVNRYLDGIVAIDAEQVRRAAARWLHPEHAATIRYLWDKAEPRPPSPADEAAGPHVPATSAAGGMA